MRTPLDARCMPTSITTTTPVIARRGPSCQRGGLRRRRAQAGNASRTLAAVSAEGQGDTQMMARVVQVADRWPLSFSLVKRSRFGDGYSIVQLYSVLYFVDRWIPATDTVQSFRLFHLRCSGSANFDMIDIL